MCFSRPIFKVPARCHFCEYSPHTLSFSPSFSLPSSPWGAFSFFIAQSPATFHGHTQVQDFHEALEWSVLHESFPAASPVASPGASPSTYLSFNKSGYFRHVSPISRPGLYLCIGTYFQGQHHQTELSSSLGSTTICQSQCSFLRPRPSWLGCCPAPLS